VTCTAADACSPSKRARKPSVPLGPRPSAKLAAAANALEADAQGIQGAAEQEAFGQLWPSMLPQGMSKWSFCWAVAWHWYTSCTRQCLCLARALAGSCLSGASLAPLHAYMYASKRLHRILDGD
jgi:hypothetical protein